jgi:erythronate-4-phosphate dehydrogenase
MKILADASLPELEQAFPEPFKLTKYYHPQEIVPLLSGQDVLLCRSTLKVNQLLLKNNCLHYVATASSGTDHLDHPWLKQHNIQIIDAKGSNASSVADYVMSSLAFLQQQHLIQGNKAGIIGFGKVGAEVAARLQKADMQVLGYDPLKELREPDTFQSCSLEELYSVDLLCIHAELHNNQSFPSNNLIEKNFLSRLKTHCVLINAARGGIVNEEDLLHSAKSLIYCTDVYLNEPNIDERIVNRAHLCTPHIAGHSLEAKYAAVHMISSRLHQIAGLAAPQFPRPQINPGLNFRKDKLWYEALLELYNPLAETLSLKQAVNKKDTFVNLRKLHQNRHDFSLYAQDHLNHKIKLLLG